MSSRLRSFCPCLLILLLGCGASDAPEVAPVKGKVTRRGEPLVGVSIQYTPQDIPEGAPRTSSIAVTNAKGEYELILNRNVMGAMIGKHKVRIDADEPVDETGKANPNAIVIPKVYNRETTLEVEVPPGGLQCGASDFDLDF